MSIIAPQDVEFFSNGNKFDHLIYAEHLFRRKYFGKKLVRFICNDKTCSCSISVGVCITIKNQHSSHTKLTTTKYLQKRFCRRLFIENPSVSASKIFERALTMLKLRMPDNVVHLNSQISTKSCIEGYISGLRTKDLAKKQTRTNSSLMTTKVSNLV
jgi:hypothetical protein